MLLRDFCNVIVGIVCVCVCVDKKINCVLTPYFTFVHLADAFIQSNLQCIQAIHFLSVCVFPGN